MVSKSSNLLTSLFSAGRSIGYAEVMNMNFVSFLIHFIYMYVSVYQHLQARVTNFSTTGESTNYKKLSKESLCNSTNTGFTTLSVTVTGQEFSVSLQYETKPQMSLVVNPGSGEPLGDLVVYFGGVPGK